MKKIRKMVVFILTMVILTGCSNSGGSVTAGANSTDTSVAKQEAVVPTEAPTPTEVPVEVPTELPTPTEEPTPTEAADPNIVRGFDFTIFNTTNNMLENFKEIESDELMLLKLTNNSQDEVVVSEVIMDGEHVEVGEFDDSTRFYLYTPKNVEGSNNLTFNILEEYGENALTYDNRGDFVDGKHKSVWRFILSIFGHEKDFVDKPLTIDVTYEDGTTGSITVYTTRVNE